MTKLYHTDTKCNAFHRCKKYRLCKTCNGIRQAKICDVVNLAARFSVRATYAVVMPSGVAQSAEIVSKLKTNCVRKLRNSTDGVFTAIETSPNDALHLNLIINHKEQLGVKPFETVAKNMGIEADIFVQEVQKDDIKNIAAYALKMAGIPSKGRYSGNLINHSGNVRTIQQILQSQKMLDTSPAIAVTSMCNTLKELGYRVPDTELFKRRSLGAKMDELRLLVAQIKEFKMCYSKRYGLLTADEFETIYNKTLAVAKRDYTNSKKAKSYFNADELWQAFA